MTLPRLPCFKFAHKIGRPDLLKEFLHSGHSGFYLRVLTEGEVGAGDLITIVERDPAGISIRTVLGLQRLHEGDRELPSNASGCPALESFGGDRDFVNRASERGFATHGEARVCTALRTASTHSMVSLRLLFLAAFTSLAPLASAAAPAFFAVEKQRANFLSGGRKISVEAYLPRGTGRFPAVLVLHSSAGTLFGKGQLERFSRSLAERGMVAFMVRYFDRTGTIFAGDKAIAANLHVWEDTVTDALDFAAAHPRVRRDSIGIFGFSLGAFLAVSVASRDARVDAVAELAGGIFDYLGGRLRRVPPMLIQHGMDDRRVNVRYAYALEREARRLGARPVVRLYPGEGHVLSKPALADASGRAMDFLAARLAPRR